MLQLVKQVQENTVPYDDAVIQGKKIISEIQGYQWALGDLVDRIEPKYGENTLRHLATELGIAEDTLRRCRATARAWPQNTPRGVFSICRDLASLPYRHEVMRDNPGIGWREARKMLREWKKSGRPPEAEEGEKEVVFPYQEPCTDCNSAEEQWQRSLGNMLGDILAMQAYWDHLFGPEWRQYKIPSSVLKLAADAKRELRSLVAGLEEHTRDTQN